MIAYRSLNSAKLALEVTEQINRELNSNGILSINELILKVTARLMPHFDKGISLEYIKENIKIEVNKVLCNNSYTFSNIMYKDEYLRVLTLMEGYIDKLLDYHMNISLYRRSDFDNQAYAVGGGKGVNKTFLVENNLVVTPEDVNSSINILNEALRRFYEIYHKKQMTVTFTDDSVIEFRLKEAEIAHLLGVNIKKIVADQRYVDLYGITPTEQDAILNCPPTPEGYKASDQALISILHRIVDMPDEIANFEEDRLKKLFQHQYPSDEDYSNKKINDLFEKYSKIVVKSKAFINFKPLEELAIVLNMPEGYTKIRNVSSPIHSLLISKNFLSDKYKWSTLVANFDKSQNRRYFMSTLVSTRNDVYQDIKNAKSHLMTKKVGLYEDDGSGSSGVVREFTEAEQIAFLSELIEDLKLAREEENTDYLDDTNSKGSHSK